MGILETLIIILILASIIIMCVWCNCTEEDSSKELFNEFGTTYLEHLEKEIENNKTSEKILKNKLERMQNKIDTCVLIFEEYFAQDQTNDDLLVMAFEQLSQLSSIGSSGFVTEDDKRKILNNALSEIRYDLKRIRRNNG